MTNGKEKLQPLSHRYGELQPWAFMLWELMVREGGKSPQGIEEKFGNLKPQGEDGPVEVEVELKVNGVPVCFSTSIDNIWERASKQYDADVMKAAKELVKGTRLQRLTEILDRFDWELEQEVTQLFEQKKFTPEQDS